MNSAQAPATSATLALRKILSKAMVLHLYRSLFGLTESLSGR